MTSGNGYDIMLDIETLGVDYDSIIAQIGLVKFDLKSGRIYDSLELNVYVDDEFEHGFKLSAKTFLWWMNQSDESRKRVFSCDKAVDRVDSRSAMLAVNDFCVGANGIWSHAPFDFVILQNHLNKLKIQPSFSYRVSRDLRTISGLVSQMESIRKVYAPKIKRGGVYHTALDDAMYQVQQLVSDYQYLFEYDTK